MLTLGDRTGPPPLPARRRLYFRSITSADAQHVVVPARGGAGDPTIGGAVLEIYNAAGTGEKFVTTLPAAGWSALDDAPTPQGYRYAARSPSDPVSRATLRTNRIRIRGGGAGFGYTLDEAAQGRVAVRLRVGTAVPWCASAPAKAVGFPPSSARYDHVDRFVAARNTPPPSVCPAP